jgi:hypothetical protein
MSGKVSGSFGYWGIKAELNAEATSQSKTKKSKHVVASTMRIERYYSSVKEDQSDLSSDAFELLDNQDYIGFFKACGPNYIRSIRRAQEVTAIFTFTSDSEEQARSFASSLVVSGYGQSAGGSYSSSSSMESISSSLTIKILGFGLGLNQDGSETLVASSLEEYDRVMKFAFKSMTQDGGNGQTGMVYGVELVPWVDNTAFQVASKLLQSDVSVPMPRSLIPKKIPISGSDQFRCKEPSYQIDKYGYCCGEDQMYDPNPPPASPSVSDETPTPVVSRVSTELICRPLRSLDPSMLKNNMANNGEFVALLDSVVRSKLNTLFTLEKCISAVRSFPNKYDYHILKSMDTVKYDAAIEVEFTVAELKMAVDPIGDYSLVNHMARELDEFMDMYYSPCLAALFGTNIGTSPETDPKYFMAESWYNHDTCTKLSCLADNMRWDRSSGGSCVASLLTGGEAPKVVPVDGDGDKCTLDIDDETGEEACKYDGAELNRYATEVSECWAGQGSGAMVPVYLMDHFCMPQLSGGKADQTRIDEIVTMQGRCGGQGGGTSTS